MKIKKTTLRFTRVADPKLPGERPLVVIDPDADRARNAARDSLDRRRNVGRSYPYSPEHQGRQIMSAQRRYRIT
jgi:hypothetical protein